MTTSSIATARRAFWALVAVIALTACGGGDEPPPPAQIGAAGGTAAGPNGAQVVVPAAALSANTAIAVTQSSSGNPAPPASHTAVGAVYAFTPHGQSFALPVTMTVPFDPALVPPGSAVKLFKTANGATGPWQEVPGATVAGNLISGSATSFSLLFAAVGNQAPSIQTGPANTAVVEPQSASFSVATNGTAPLAYQWLRSDGGATFAAIDGATASTYTTGATTVANDNGDRYRVVVSNLEGSAQSVDVMLTVTLTAPPTAALTVSIAGTGTVTSAPAGINCGADCAEAFALNTSVTLTATPGAGFNFAGFSGDADCSDGTLTMSAARACTATFTATAGSLTGSWISNYQCTGTGGSFNGQDTLTVTQTGASVSFSSSDGGSFTGTLNGNTMTYSGGGPGYTETGTWTMRGANGFTKTSNYVNTGGTGGSCPGAGQRQGVPFNLLVIVTGNGRVSDGSGGINLCESASGDCEQAYSSGTQVTLSATGNAPGVVFNGWGAACFDVPSPFAARVVMDSSKTCTASFSP